MKIDMKEFLKIMEKDITEDKFSMFDACFYLGMVAVIGVAVFVMVNMLEWLVSLM